MDSIADALHTVFGLLPKYVREEQRREIYGELLPKMDLITQQGCLSADPVFDAIMEKKYPEWFVERPSRLYPEASSPVPMETRNPLRGLVGYYNLKNDPEQTPFLGMRFRLASVFQGVPVPAGSVVRLDRALRSFEGYELFNVESLLDTNHIEEPALQDVSELDAVLEVLPSLSQRMRDELLATMPERDLLQGLWESAPDVRNFFPQTIPPGPWKEERRRVVLKHLRNIELAKSTARTLGTLHATPRVFSFWDVKASVLYKMPEQTFVESLAACVRLPGPECVPNGGTRNQEPPEFMDVPAVERILAALHDAMLEPV